MKTKTKWTIGFLSVTALAIVMEVIAATDSNPDTVPWTTLIVDHVPYEFTFLVIGGMSVWLMIHFLRWYGIIKE